MHFLFSPSDFPLSLSFSRPPSAHLGVSSTHLGGHLQRAIRGRSAHGSTAAPPQSLCAFCLSCGSTRAGQYSVSAYTCIPAVQYSACLQCRYLDTCIQINVMAHTVTSLKLSSFFSQPGCCFCGVCRCS